MQKQIKLAIILIIIGGLLTTAAFFMSFYTARVRGNAKVFVDGVIADTAFHIVPEPPFEATPSEVAKEYFLEGTHPLALQMQEEGVPYERPWFSQKIFYFHVPVGEASFLIFTVAAIFAVLFLLKREEKYDARSRIAMETALVFVVATMITGVMWTRAGWGVWWDWTPRLTTFFIMMVLMIAYFVIRNSVDDEERAATYAAVFCIIAWVDAPISFLITRLIPDKHPVVFNSGMDTTNLIPFIIAQIGMLAFGYAIYVLRASEEDIRLRLDAVKEGLEG